MIVILFDSERNVIYCTSCTNYQLAQADCQHWIDGNNDSWRFVGDWDARYIGNGDYLYERKVAFEDPDGVTNFTFEIYRSD